MTASSLPLMPDIEARDECGWTSLRTVSWEGHPAVVQVLLKAGADIQAKDKYGGTWLHKASQHGHPAVVEALLKDVCVYACCIDTPYTHSDMLLAFCSLYYSSIYPICVYAYCVDTPYTHSDMLQEAFHHRRVPVLGGFVQAGSPVLVFRLNIRSDF